MMPIIDRKCLSSFPHEPITFYIFFASLSLSFFLFSFFSVCVLLSELHGRRSGMESFIYCLF